MTLERTVSMNTWTGRKTYEHHGTFEEIRAKVPSFQKEDFALEDGGENKYTDVIVMNPADGGEPVPVSTVSKGYSLIQHRTVMDSTSDALKELGYNINDLKSQVNLTEYGERMWGRIRFPEQHSFDPGDGHKLDLELHFINSVDKSTRLIFEIGWYRMVCTNGLISRVKSTTTRRKHTISLVPEFLSEYFKQTIVEMETEPDRYKSLHLKKVAIGQEDLENWVDKTVAPKWGVRLAARSYNILRTGYDGKPSIAHANKDAYKYEAHKIPVNKTTEVPGQPQEAETAYDVVNALSWIASHQDSLQTRYDQMKQVPELVSQLQ